MRISDWSSDVCSSDLAAAIAAGRAEACRREEFWCVLRDHRAIEDEAAGAQYDAALRAYEDGFRFAQLDCDGPRTQAIRPAGGDVVHGFEIGRASCRERVVQYV